MLGLMVTYMYSNSPVALRALWSCLPHLSVSSFSEKPCRGFGVLGYNLAWLER